MYTGTNNKNEFYICPPCARCCLNDHKHLTLLFLVAQYKISQHIFYASHRRALKKLSSALCIYIHIFGWGHFIRLWLRWQLERQEKNNEPPRHQLSKSINRRHYNVWPAETAPHLFYLWSFNKIDGHMQGLRPTRNRTSPSLLSFSQMTLSLYSLSRNSGPHQLTSHSRRALLTDNERAREREGRTETMPP